MAPPIPTPKTTKIPGTATPTPDTRHTPAQPGFNPQPAGNGQTIEVPGRPGVETETNRDKATGPGGQRLVGNAGPNGSSKTGYTNTSALPVDANVDSIDMGATNTNAAQDTDLAGDTKPL